MYADDALAVDPEIFELGIPILGICYGMQLMAYKLGGQVAGEEHGQYGHADIEVTVDDTLFKGLPKEQPVG